MHDKIKTNLEYRTIMREQDKDFFIETFSYPVNLLLEIPYMSRIQFPSSRAVLVRTTPCNDWVTLHIMRDIDLYSSFANFELDLEGKELLIEKKDGYIEICIKVE